MSALPLIAADSTTPAAKTVAPPEAMVSAALTNLSRSTPKKDGLKSFEEDISRSFEVFSPKGAFNGVRAPQYRPPPPVIIQNARPKDDLDWKGKWMLENVSGKADFSRKTDFGADSLQPSPGSASKSKDAALDAFFESLNRQQKEMSNKARKPAEDSKFDDAASSSGLRTGPKSLEQTLFGTEAMDRLFKPDLANSSIPSLFGPSPVPAGRQEIQAHKDYLDRFKQILDGPSPGLSGSQNLLGATAAPGIATPGQSTVPVYNGLSPLSSAPKFDSFNSSPGLAGTIPNPTLMQDANSHVLNQWNPLYNEPKPELSRPAPVLQEPAAPMWESMRRRF